LRDYGLTLAASVVLAFFVSVAPEHWRNSQCDAIAINSVAALICGGLVLALVGSIAHDDAPTRTLALAAAGSLPLAVFLLFEPRCIHGPFALVDPGIWPVWHDQVRELQPLLAVFRVNPLTAAAIAAFPVAALLSMLRLAQESKLRRDFAYLATAAVFLAAAVTMVAAIRGFSYAIWLGMPLVAAVALRLFATFGLERLVPRFAAAALLTPLAISAGAITVAVANGLNDTDSFTRPASRHCTQIASYAPLARLPAGLVVTDISYGPHLLALTPHSVMAAPYHRLGSGIVMAHQALASPPDEARQILQAAKVTYVAICGPRPPDGLPEPARSQSLWGRLQAGAVPGWLERMTESNPAGFSIYRLRSTPG
jgi:hypothetical protein